jgi:glycosyltransferase involved in cell wall biosynthesis
VNIWLRIHGYELCSWTFVWDSLRTAFLSQGDNVFADDRIRNPEDWVEVWWGDPQYWQWSGLPVRAKIAIVVSEAHSILAQGRNLVIDNLNEADMIICASQCSTTAFMEAPIETPIKVVWFGVDTDEFKYVNRDWTGTIKYLHGGVNQFRKGSWLVPEAFVEAFTGNDDVELTIATPRVLDMFSRMRIEYGGHPKITFIDELQDNAIDLYSSHHIYVSPHLSEGFGLMIPEAMSTGMACLVSRCSSPREFFDKKYGWWIEMSEDYAPVSQCLTNTSGFWRLPDISSLVECMRESYNSIKETKKRGIAGSDYVRKNLTWELCAAKIKQIISEVLNEKNIGNNISV